MLAQYKTSVNKLDVLYRRIKLKYTLFYWIKFCLFVFSLLSSATATAKILTIQPEQSLNLAAHYQFFIDPKHQYKITDFISPGSQLHFNVLPQGEANLGYKDETYWFKVDISNPNEKAVDKLLELNYPLLDYVAIYTVKSTHAVLSKHVSGDLFPFSQREIKHRNFLFPLTFPANTKTSLYIQIRTDGSMNANAKLWTPDVFPTQHKFENFTYDIYFGLLIALMGYNLLLFISIKERCYFYYVLFSASMLLAVGSFTGRWFELFWPNAPLLHNLAIPLGFSLSGLFATLFSRSFLHTASKAPVFDHILNFIAIAFILSIVAYPFVPVLYISPAISLITILLSITAILVSTHLSIKGNHFAQVYLVAWLSLMLGAMLFSAKNIGWLPSNGITNFSILVGSALEMVLLSFALSLRINFLKHENEKARQELFNTHQKLIDSSRQNERSLNLRVLNRTRELTEANLKLLSHETKLKKMAHYDALTGLANRSLLIEQLELLLNRAKRQQTKLAVLFLDLDGFKPINDIHGHRAGDMMLIATAKKLRSMLRDSDVVGRLGGDEFIILLESTNDNIDVAEVIEKIKRAVSEPVIVDNKSLKVDVSIGMAMFPDDGDNSDRLISVSDQRMYEDKVKSGNQDKR